MQRRRWVVLAWLGVPALLAAVLAGQFSYAVLGSTSMEPWAASGALVIHRSVPADEVEVDDVVTVDAPGRGLVTHRVVGLAPSDGDGVVARLRGDRNAQPDAAPVELVGDVAVAVAQVPVLGRVLRIAGPMTGVAVALLALGVVTLAFSTAEEPTPGAVTGSQFLDPRIEALLATCEQFAEDGMAPEVLADLVRVRVAAALGLPEVEDADACAELDDGARFYVVALADADPDALGLVPPGSTRRRAGSAAVDQWWQQVADRVPDDVHTALRDLVTSDRTEDVTA